MSHMKMLILKYFKSAPMTQDKELPQPSSKLSNVMPPKAIEMANAEEAKVKNKAPRGVARSAPYLFLRPSQRYEVGKRATEHVMPCSSLFYRI